MYDNDDGCGGCLTLLIIAAIFCWISDNWITILLVIGGLIAIVALIAGVKSYQAKAPEREAQAKAKAQKEADDKRAREYASYIDYFQAMRGAASAENTLKVANTIIHKLHDETDESKRIKILAFFDRYLPVMTEIIEASKHGDADIDDSIKRFTDAVKAFSKSLYKVDDVVDVNSAVLENMAIRDGFYDPYAENLSFDNEVGDESVAEDVKDPTVEVSVTTEELHKAEAPAAETTHKPRSHKPSNTVEDVEMAMQDRLEEAILMDDFDTIREMLDSGVISEFDVDEDVLEKVEDYV